MPGPRVSVLPQFPTLGLAAWYKSDSIVLGNGAVAGLLDVSGNGLHLSQPTPANRPPFTQSDSLLSGRPSIVFTAASSTNLVSAAQGPLANGFTFILVHYRPSVANGGESFGWGGNSGNGFAFAIQSLSRSMNMVNGTPANDGAAVTNAAECWIGTMTGTTPTLYVNGVAATLSPSTTTYTQGAGNNFVALGGIWTGAAVGLFDTITFAEGAIYSRALTAPEAILWSRYAGAKYGIVVP